MEQLRTKQLRSLVLSQDLISLQEAVVMRNRTFSQQLAIADQTTPNGTFIVAAVVTNSAKLTGNFRVDVDYRFTLTATHTVTAELLSLTKGTAFPANLVNGTVDATAGSNTNYRLNADAAGNPANGLTFGGGTTDFSLAQHVCIAGVAPASFSLHFGAITISSLLPGDSIAFALRVTSAAGTLSDNAANISVYELP